MSRLCVYLLLLVALVVLVGLAKGRTMWQWIVAYWLILSVKNAADLNGGKPRK